MKTNERIYNCKDVEMLIATATLVEAAISNKEFLQAKRSNWTDEFFNDLKTRIDTVTQQNLGVDSAKELRQSTQVLTKIQKQALTDLAEVKVQLDEDFSDDKPQRTEILKTLGFTGHLKNARGGDQEALISLLFAFKQNLSPALRSDIINKGTARASLDAIIVYADTLKTANINQETFKGSKKTITAEAAAQFNGIYNDVIKMSKIAAKFFKEQPHKKELFSFNKIVKALNAQPGTAEPKAA